MFLTYILLNLTLTSLMQMDYSLTKRNFQNPMEIYSSNVDLCSILDFLLNKNMVYFYLLKPCYFMHVIKQDFNIYLFVSSCPCHKHNQTISMLLLLSIILVFLLHLLLFSYHISSVIIILRYHKIFSSLLLLALLSPLLLRASKLLNEHHLYHLH